MRHSVLRGPWSKEELYQYPYGNDWDILHLGASRVVSGPAPFSTLATIYPDLSPPGTHRGDCEPDKHWFCFGPVMKLLAVPAQSRAIIPSHRSLGLAAIAVSLRGAQRLLYLLSWRSLDKTLDWSISAELESGRVKGWTVMPPLFGTWAPGGGGFGDSDINKGAEGLDLQANGGNIKGVSRGTADSVRSRFSELIESESRWDVLARTMPS
jgi:hypothetical protein